MELYNLDGIKNTDFTSFKHNQKSILSQKAI